MSGINDHDRAHIGRIIADGYGDWFTAHLLRLIKKADAENRTRLATLYPEEVAAVIEWEQRPGDDELAEPEVVVYDPRHGYLEEGAS